MVRLLFALFLLGAVAQASGSGRDLVYTEKREPCRDYRPERMALFGDLHVHTALSFDAVAGRINTRPATIVVITSWLSSTYTRCEFTS